MLVPRCWMYRLRATRRFSSAWTMAARVSGIRRWFSWQVSHAERTWSLMPAARSSRRLMLGRRALLQGHRVPPRLSAVEDGPVQDEGGRAGVRLGGEESRVLVQVGGQEADLGPGAGPLDVGLGVDRARLLGQRGQLGSIPHGVIDQGLDLCLVQP